MGNQFCSAFKYIGLEIHQDSSGITLDQKSYIDSINPIFCLEIGL